MAIVNSAGADLVAFFGDFIGRATYLGGEKIWPKDANISVIIANANPAQNAPMWGEYSQASGMVYTARRTTSNSVGAFDVARGKLVKVFESNPTTSAGFNSITFTEDGSRGWVSADSGVYLFDPTLGVGAKIDATAAWWAVSPSGGSEVYVSHRNSRLVRVYGAESNAQVGADIPTPNGGDKLAANASGSQVYSMSVAGKCVYVIDTASKTVLGAPITDTAKGIGSGIAGGSGNRCYTCRDSVIYSINTDTGTVEHQYEATGVVFNALRYVPETSRLYGMSDTGKVIHVFDTSGSVPALVDTISLRMTGVQAMAPYDGGNWAITVHTPIDTSQRASNEIVYLGPAPDSTAVTAIAPEPWQPATGWVNSEPLPPQPMPDPEPIADAF